MRSTWTILGCSALLLAACATATKGRPAREYVSPDGKFRAVVIPLANAPGGAGESRVELRSINGTTLLNHSYASEDGEHGLGIERASWTPDSKFFVYSMSSSGGHQPWNAPIDFISVSEPALESLDDHIGAIGDPSFQVASPDLVRVTVFQAEDFDGRIVEVSLASLDRPRAADAEEAVPPNAGKRP